ncbi:hypothetical protein HKX48_003831 [Thoreauomyces humboldtii]|nr:hypothetical protein HKX48_003831 [Thoreauomyces humboldtii]
MLGADASHTYGLPLGIRGMPPGLGAAPAYESSANEGGGNVPILTNASRDRDDSTSSVPGANAVYSGSYESSTGSLHGGIGVGRSNSSIGNHPTTNGSSSLAQHLQQQRPLLQQRRASASAASSQVDFLIGTNFDSILHSEDPLLNPSANTKQQLKQSHQRRGPPASPPSAQSPTAPHGSSASASSAQQQQQQQQQQQHHLNNREQRQLQQEDQSERDLDRDPPQPQTRPRVHSPGHHHQYEYGLYGSAPAGNQHMHRVDGIGNSIFSRYHMSPHQAQMQQQQFQQHLQRQNSSDQPHHGRLPQQNQELPPFSAAESVLRFLATTDAADGQDHGPYSANAADTRAGSGRSGQDEGLSDGNLSEDDIFLGRFADLALHNDPYPLHDEYPGYSGEANDLPGAYPPSTDTDMNGSGIRPFMFNSFLGTSAELGLSADDYRYVGPQHHSQHHSQHHLSPHHQQSHPNYDSLRGRAYAAGGNQHYRDYDDVFDHQHQSSYGYAKGYNAVPPPGYICKLCFVEGHWLKNCNLYQNRRRNDFMQFFPSGSHGKYDSIMHHHSHQHHQHHIPRGLARHSGSPTQMHMHMRLPQKTTVPPEGYVCRKCNTPGHWIQQCAQPKQSCPPDGYTCKICLVKGHWIHQCPLRNGPSAPRSSLSTY